MLLILSGHETPSTEFLNTTEIHCSPFLTEEYSHSHNGHTEAINFVSNLVLITFVMDIRNMTYMHAFNINRVVCMHIHLTWSFWQLMSIIIVLYIIMKIGRVHVYLLFGHSCILLFISVAT